MTGEPVMQINDMVTLTAEMQIQGDWHIGCEVRYGGVTVQPGNTYGMMTFWCPGHSQYVYVFPSERTFHYPGFPDLRR